jgi:hypothetical protein
MNFVFDLTTCLAIFCGVYAVLVFLAFQRNCEFEALADSAICAAERAALAIDDTLAFITESNQRIECMEVKDRQRL